MNQMLHWLFPVHFRRSCLSIWNKGQVSLDGFEHSNLVKECLVGWTQVA